MSDESQADTSWWTAPSPTIALDKHGGGVLAIELVAPATVTILATPHLTVSGTLVEADVMFAATHLPPRKDLPCKVQWEYERGSTHTIEGAPAEMDVPAGKVHVTLDIMSAGVEIGALLATGGPVAIVLTPDWPHVRPARVVAGSSHTLAIDVKVAGKTVELGQLGGVGHIAVGEPLVVELQRGGFQCAARLRVDTPTDEDVAVEWAQDAVGPQNIRLGCKGDTLELPRAVRLASGGSPQLPFDIYLEVSKGDGVFAPVRAARVTVSQPTLASFEVSKGAGIAELSRTDGSSSSPDSAVDHTVTAHGRLTGFTPGFDPPFAVELWLLSPAPPPRRGQRRTLASMHRVFPERRAAIGALADNGSFAVVLDTVFDPDDAAAYVGVTPFAVLRGAITGEPPLEPGLSTWCGLRRFSDEDFCADKSAALGLCSREITKGVRASRMPVLGHVTAAVVKDAIRMACGVLGPKALWDGAKPKFILTTEGGEKALSLHAKYEPVRASARGFLVAAVPFKSLGGHAGKRVTIEVELDAAKSVDVVRGEGAGHLTIPLLRPALDEVRWWEDVDPKKHTPRLHFLCPTQWFPKTTEPLCVSFDYDAAEPGTPSAWQPWGGKVQLEHPAGGTGLGSVDDDGLEFFVTDTAQIAEAKALLAESGLLVRVACRAGKEKLYGNPGLEVSPSEGFPRRALG